MNKKTFRRLWCALLAVCCLAGLGAAASGGDGAAPASLSYLRDTFLPALEKGIAARVKEDTRAVSDAALSRVDEIGKTHAGTADPVGWKYSGAFQPMDLKGGDALAVAEGGSLLWLAGSATGTGLVDATTGTEIPVNGQLIAGHRYLNGQEGYGSVINILSDAAQAAPAGRWKVVAGGREVTAFYDLAKTDWFYDGVRWAVAQGWFRGVSPTRFDPYGTLDRAMVATLLHRIAGTPAVPFRGLFSDVPRGEWYTEAIEWAASNGIADGSGEGSFSPDRPAGREEIVDMLYRCSKHLGLDTSASASLEGFADSAAVSPSTRDAVSWAVGIGILKGSDGSLLPKDNITRAEAALLFQRFQTWRDKGG